MSARHAVPNQTPVPLGKVGLLGMILLANNTSIWMIFSFLPFMVQFYYPSLPTTELGFEAGLLGSAFSAGGLIGNLVSGIISDRVGRRPALLWGLAGTAVSSLCFGFSPTFWFAVAARFMWGALNGNIGVAKTYLAEISDDTNLARSMAYFGVIGSTGRVIGPILGGLLSYPADTFSIFKHTVFDSHPFALPALVVSTNCIIMFLVAYFYLPETLNVKSLEVYKGHTDRASRSSRSRGGLEYAALQTNDTDTMADTSVHDNSGSGLLPIGRPDTANDGSDAKGGIELRDLNHSAGNTGDHNSLDPTGGTANPMLTAATLGSRGFVLLEEGKKRFSGDTDEESEAEFKEPDGGTPLSAGVASSSVGGTIAHTKTLGHSHSDTDLEAGRLLSSRPLHAHRSSSAKGRGHRRGISFSSHVRVKVIDSHHVFIQSLKQVDPNEVPLSDPFGGARSARRSNSSSGIAAEEAEGSDAGGEDDLQEQLLPPAVRYSNGSEYFESVDSSQASLWSSMSYLLRQRHVVITTTLYGFSSFVVIIGNEIFTLWVVTSPADGGLAYTTQQIGTSIMICGMIATVLQLTLYPAATDYLGVLWVHRYGGLAFALSSIFIPMLSLGVHNRPAIVTMIFVVLALTLQAIAANWYLVSTFVLISNSCYRHQLATVNGIGQTCASIGRLCGPYLGSVLFAWSETNGLSWPFNQYFVFYLLALLSMLIYQYSLLLPRTIQRRKREPRFRTWEEGEEWLRRQQELERAKDSEAPGGPQGDGGRAVAV
jgi:MFS family permease